MEHMLILPADDAALLPTLCACMLVISFLYSTVGHAGASGYLAIMSLFGLAPEFIKPVALILNILVAAVAAWQFYRAGHSNWSLFWPFALLSLPCAFIGGFLDIPTHVFRIILGIVLLFSAIVLLVKMRTSDVATPPPRPVALGVGAGLGFMAGLTGTGGGIFLTPALLLFRWAGTRTASATSALFILVNSISGLLGFVGRSKQLPAPEALAPLLVTVLIGGTIGSYLGSRRFSKEMIRMFLAAVLAIASCKLILGAS
ncbi:MAG: sulfite exporter TauE/SafE family protein [bacterium]